VGPAQTVPASRWLLLVSAMVSFFAVGTTFFAVPPLVDTLRRAFMLSNADVGLLMGAIAVPAVFLSLPLGAALDRWPPRAAGLAGLAAMLAGATAFAVAPTFLVLLAGRIVFGVGGLVLNLLLARLISSAFGGRELALAMGLFTGVYPASMIVMFSLHPWLAATLGWRGELGALAALVAVAMPLHAVSVRGGADRAAAGQPAKARAVLGRPLLALGVGWMLYWVCFGAVATFVPEWAGGGAAGLLIASVITWVAMVGTPVAGALIDRTGRPERWCAAGAILLVVALAMMAAGVLPPLAAMAALGAVCAVTPPAFYSLPARIVPQRRIAFAFGFITALSNFGALLGPWLAGVVRDATPRWGPLWGAFAGVALASAVAVSLVGPRRAVAHP
jgi:predicted MFS family arabinose efflux permease